MRKIKFFTTMSRYYRAHRGTLKDSMDTVVEVSSRAELAKHVSKEIDINLGEGDLIITRYGYDGRIGWHTYIVAINEPSRSVVGFLDGPIDEHCDS